MTDNQTKASSPYEEAVSPPQDAYPPGFGGTVLHTGLPQQTVIQDTQVIAGHDAREPPPNYIPFAVIVTFFGCLPIGLIALMKAMKARNLWQTGDVVRAHQAAQEARKWCIMSLLVGSIILVLTGVVMRLLVI